MRVAIWLWVSIVALWVASLLVAASDARRFRRMAEEDRAQRERRLRE